MQSVLLLQLVAKMLSARLIRLESQRVVHQPKKADRAAAGVRAPALWPQAAELHRKRAGPGNRRKAVVPLVVAETEGSAQEMSPVLPGGPERDMNSPLRLSRVNSAFSGALGAHSAGRFLPGEKALQAAKYRRRGKERERRKCRPSRYVSRKNFSCRT
jgi:hypothetical protein